MEGSLSAFRDVVEKIVILKQNQAEQHVLEAACKAGTLLLLQLREHHKQATLQVERVKDDTAGYKTKLDHFSQQLHNLLYEKQYYEKEVLSCRSFQSAVSDEQVSLIALDEFLQSAPAEHTKGLGGDAHKLMLSRLTFELNQRKQLSQRLLELQKLQQQEATHLGNRKAGIDDLQVRLKGLQQATTPLQEVLAPSLAFREQNKTADLLPLPLYIIYSQFAAAQDALGLSVEVTISGSTDEAARLGSAAQPSSSGPDKQHDTSAAKRRRTDLFDDDLYKVGHAVMCVKLGCVQALCSMCCVAAAPLACTPAGHAMIPAMWGMCTLQVHPLSVEVNVFKAGTAEHLLEVVFQYFTNLKLVGAFCADAADDSILGNLFSGDTGNPSLYEGLAQLSSVQYEFGSSRVRAQPYRYYPVAGVGNGGLTPAEAPPDIYQLQTATRTVQH